MTTATRKKLPPVAGWSRWVGREVNGNRLLEICPDGGLPKTYEVEELGPGVHALYSLDKKTWEVVRYVVKPTAGHPGVFECDCPDAKERADRRYCCKHVRGLRAALKKLARTEPF